jgi:hypothetical protein
MAHPPPDSNGYNGVEPTADRPPGTPRWVKVFGIIVIVVVLLFVAMLVIGGEALGAIHRPVTLAAR